MRIVQLTPGTGNFICGSCVRDNTLVRALRTMAQDVAMVPLYLPHALDEEPTAGDTPVLFGGINVYLQQKFPLAGYLPRWVQRTFDRPALLRWLSNHSGMTRAKDLGELAVSMVQGEHGHQHRELDKLLHYLRQHGRPDVVCLSNAMLLGLARRIRAELGCAVVCTLAGEDGFLDALVEPYRTQAWAELQRRVADADALIAVSRYYASVMTRRLAAPADRVHVVHNGIDTTGFEPAAAHDPSTPPAIGFLARLCAVKGLATLVEAYIALRRRRPDLGAVRLILAGSMTAADRPFVDQQMKRLHDAGLSGDVELLPNLDHAAKQRMLRRIRALSVPATYGESFGLYLLEAWASGVPVVQPRHAAFPELLELTGGGILVAPDDAGALAAGLAELIESPEAAREMGRRGRDAVLRHFTADHMAGSVLEIFRRVTGRSEDPAEVADEL